MNSELLTYCLIAIKRSFLSFFIFLFISFIFYSDIKAEDADVEEEQIYEKDISKYNKPSKVIIDDQYFPIDHDIEKTLEKFLENQKTPLPSKENRFRIINSSSTEEWTLLTIILLDLGNQTISHAYNSESLYIAHKDKGQWEIANYLEPSFNKLLAQVPISLISKEAKNFFYSIESLSLNRLSFVTSSTLNHKLPWPKEKLRQWWSRGGNPWHNGAINPAIDFGSNSLNDRTFVATERAVVSKICTGNLTQDIELRYSDGSRLIYRHFQKGTLPNEIQMNAIVEKGQILGLTRDGNFGEYTNCNEFVNADQPLLGSSHLHLEIPSGRITLEGWYFESPNTFATRNGITKNVNDWFLSEVDDYVVVPSNNTDFPDTRPGDFNGDGKDDVIYITPADEVFVDLSTNSNFGDGQDIWTYLGAPFETIQWDIGDIDADGNDDLVIAKPGNEFDVCLSNYPADTSFDCNFVKDWGGELESSQWDLINATGTAGDDILHVSEGNEFRVLTRASNGTYDINAANTVWKNLEGDIYTTSWRISDLGGDQYKDIIFVDADADFYYLRFSSTGTYLTNPTLIHAHGGVASGSLTEYEWRLGDFNGDGWHDVVSVNSDNTFYISRSNTTTGNYATGVWIMFTTYDRDETRWEVWNGDGNFRSDILIADPNTTFFAYITNPAGTGIGTLYNKAYGPGTPLNTVDFKLGNFDGDGAGTGKEDIALILNDNRTILVHSTGTEFFHSGGYWMDLEGSQTDYEFRVGNYHNPGGAINPPDIVIVKKNSSTFSVATPHPNPSPITFSGWTWTWVDHIGSLTDHEWR